RSGGSTGYDPSRCVRSTSGWRHTARYGTSVSIGSSSTSTSWEVQEMTERTGVLEQAGQQWRLRFTRHLAHPPDKVWRALTEPEHLAAWFLLAFEPPRLVEFRWGTDTIRL